MTEAIEVRLYDMDSRLITCPVCQEHSRLERNATLKQGEFEMQAFIKPCNLS